MRNLSAVSISIILFLVGCVSGVETPPTPAISTVTSLSSPAAATSLPVHFEDISQSYSAVEQATSLQGKAISTLFAQGELRQIYARFDDKLKSQVPFSELENVATRYTQQAQMGALVETRVVVISGQSYAITAHTWGDQGLALYSSINPDETIRDISIAPLRLTPLDLSQYPPSPVTFRLPFNGLWYVGWGGTDELHNYHVTTTFQQFAYDFVIWKDGSTCRPDCSQNTDYFAFGQPVLAPASGKVIAVVKDQPDSLPHQVNEEIDAGNYVIIQVAEGEYLFICHMQQGSVQVSVGNEVQAGEMLGRVGSSGSSSEPHIHIHLQDSPRFSLYGVTGLPLFFSDYLANGESVERGIPSGSQFLQPK